MTKQEQALQVALSALDQIDGEGVPAAVREIASEAQAEAQRLLEQWEEQAPRRDLVRLFMSPARAIEAQRLMDTAATAVETCEVMDQLTVRGALVVRFSELEARLDAHKRYLFERQADHVIASAIDKGIFAALSSGTGWPQEEIDLVLRAMGEPPAGSRPLTDA